MKGYETSFFGMFQPATDGMPSVNRVEIPLIQRDYAQGRENAAVQVIRRDFLDVLIDAITGGDPGGLDFVYGDIEDDTLRPLDGQQRLTTLFLIHWYVAARTGRLAEAGHWLNFAYATRPTAELFCDSWSSPSTSRRSTSRCPRTGSRTRLGTCSLAPRPERPVDARDARCDP